MQSNQHTRLTPSQQTAAVANQQSMAEHSPSLYAPKLRIGNQIDAYEREADAVALRVVTGQANQVHFSNEKKEYLQKMDEEEGQAKMELQKMDEEEGQAKAANHGGKPSPQIASPWASSKVRSSSGMGHALPSHTLQLMSTRFGADFSEVKIHSDQTAEKLNSELKAKAFTVGKDIYFNRQEFNPNTRTGQTLLAHELTHTIQQGAVKSTARGK